MRQISQDNQAINKLITFYQSDIIKQLKSKINKNRKTKTTKEDNENNTKNKVDSNLKKYLKEDTNKDMHYGTATQELFINPYNFKSR